MPCPELAFTGLNRFWAVKEQLDTSAYRGHCRRIAGAVAGAIEVHVRRGDEVILVGIEGSPSLGVHVTEPDPERGGRPVWPDGSDEWLRVEASSSRSLQPSSRRAASNTPRRWGSRISSPITTPQPSVPRSPRSWSRRWTEMPGAFGWRS